MIAFSCPGCGKSFSVKDEFAGRKTKCSKCDTSVRVPAAANPAVVAPKPAPSVAIAAAPAAVVAAPAAAPRFFFIQNGQRFGSVTLKQLQDRVAANLLHPEDLVWREGSPQWVAARDVPELFPKTPIPVVLAPALAVEIPRKPNGASTQKFAASLPAVLALAGAVVGFMVVRGFMLDEIQEIGWRLFWYEFFKGSLKSGDWEMVFTSATFMKVLVGTSIGGAVGFIIGSRMMVSNAGDVRGDQAGSQTGHRR